MSQDIRKVGQVSGILNDRRINFNAQMSIDGIELTSGIKNQSPFQPIGEDNIATERKETTVKARDQGSLMWFIAIVLCTSSVPVINLILLLYQPGGLSNTVAKNVNKTINLDEIWSQIAVVNAGRNTQFTIFYIVIGLYLFVSLVFITYSCFLGPNIAKRLKLFFMVDNILICMIATDIAYTYLHIINFTTTYETDLNMIIITDNDIRAEDIVIIVLYCFTNFALTGIFRVLMVFVDWKPWQIILYKMGIIGSSMTYVIVGLIYLLGNDQVSSQIEQFSSGIVDLIQNLLWVTGWSDVTGVDPFYLSVSMYLDRQIVGIKDVQSTMDNFMLLYVFSNFGFSFEIVAKLTDFDGTADLKTKYRLVEPEQ